jgi:AcrR family transcriptional regulator
VKKPVAPITEAVHSALDALESKVDGRSSRWAAHRAARREELIDAAIVAISSHGASVGMDQIAAVAGTSKPVIYRYFADKTELYRAVTERVVGQVLATLTRVTSDSPPPRELIHHSIDAYLALLEDNPELYRFVAQHPHLTRSAAGTPAATDFSTVVAELLATQLGAHLHEIGLDPAFAHPWGEAIVGFIRAASLWWLDHRDAMARQQLSDYLGALLWGGAAGVYQSAGQDADATAPAGAFPRAVRRSPH